MKRSRIFIQTWALDSCSKESKDCELIKFSKLLMRGFTEAYGEISFAFGNSFLTYLESFDFRDVFNVFMM